jgi:hypothetical protein
MVAGVKYFSLKLLRTNRIVIPTGAYPDFLLHDAGNDHGCDFLQENRMMLINATNPDRKSGGAQWRDLRFFPVLTPPL